MTVNETVAMPISLRLQLPDTWRMFDPATPDERSESTLSTTQARRDALPLAKGLITGLRNGDYQLCAFGPVVTGDDPQTIASVTVRIDHDPTPGIADRTFEHAQRTGVPGTATITPFEADAGEGVRVAWQAHHGTTQAWCAEYFLYYPEGGRIAVIGTSVIAPNPDAALLEITDAIIGSTEFRS